MTIEQEKLIEKNIKYAYWKASVWSKKQQTIDYDELCSICLFSLTQAAESYDPKKCDNFASYVSFCMNNKIITELKKANNYNKYIIGSIDIAEEEDFITEDNTEESMRLREAIKKLPEEYQKIVYDFYEAGYNQYEIAEKYNVSQTKISIALKKAKEMIATYLNS